MNTTGNIQRGLGIKPAVEAELAKPNTQFLMAIRGNDTAKALEFIDQPGVNLTKKISLTGNELTSKNVLDKNGPEATVATLALLHLFDPTNGWGRDCAARPDILELGSRIVEKGGRLEGITFWRGTDFEGSLLDTVQAHINGNWLANDTTPARVTEEIKQRFAEAGYQFNYARNASGKPLSVRQTSSVEERNRSNPYI